MEGRYLEIKDEYIIKCIQETDKWYAFASMITHEFGINEYSLWLGRIQWGDNQLEDVVAHLKDGKIFFRKNREMHTELVAFIIYAWVKDESIIIDFNDAINKAVDALDKQSDINVNDIFEEYLFISPYSFHEGELL